MKQFRFSSGYVPDQGAIDLLFSLYNQQHIRPSTLTFGPFIVYCHFITAMVDIATSGDLLLIIDPYIA